MMKTVLSFLAPLALVAMSLFAFHATAQAQAPPQIRTISGVALNATAGGGPVSGLTVTLHRVDSAGMFDNLTTTTDDSGTFIFTGIEYDPNRAYGVSVRYDGAIYGTDIDLANGSADDVRLTVYDGTSDDAIVSTGAASLLLADADPSDQTLAALEIIYLVNRSDKTYVPGEGVMELLRFGLPPEATDLTLDTRLIGADFVQVDRGFALLASVPPGEHEVMYSYRFPYESAEFTLDKTYRYGGESVRILAPEEVASVSRADAGRRDANSDRRAAVQRYRRRRAGARGAGVHRAWRSADGFRRAARWRKPGRDPLRVRRASRADSADGRAASLWRGVADGCEAQGGDRRRDGGDCG